MRVLLSFNPEDVALAEAFGASLFVSSPGLEIFFSPSLFEERRRLKMQHADAFLLFVSWHGLTDRQIKDYHAGIERRAREGKFSVARVLAAGAKPSQALPDDLTWIEVPVVTDRVMLSHVIRALDEHGSLSAPSQKVRCAPLPDA